MIQSVYKNELRDPKQITELANSLNGNKFKSVLGHKNSINASNFHESAFVTNGEMDVSRFRTFQGKSRALPDDRVSRQCSTLNVISCCQNHDEKLFKSIWDGKFSKFRNPRSARATKINENVVQFNFLETSYIMNNGMFLIILNNRWKQKLQIFTQMTKAMRHTSPGCSVYHI